MFSTLKVYRIALSAGLYALTFVTVKYLFHQYSWELVEQSSLHNGVISSATFVIGFLLSATIADYKESERIPSDFAANLEDMYEDTTSIHTSYPVFDLRKFGQQLQKIGQHFGLDARDRSLDVSHDIRDLSPYFVAMEAGKVPANFIVKLKQQQLALLRSRNRVSYIQNIRFIPSATVLARSIVALVLILLLCTNVDPFYGGLAIAGIISFVFAYILILLDEISLPFHPEGKTMDDVSLFLVKDAVIHLETQLPPPTKSRKRQSGQA